jgi:S-DNA-T family DNA segregation ATPase FtsK/SpoIIIE
MARKQEDKDKSKSQEARSASGLGRRVFRYCCVLLLAGAVALVWLSLRTFSPTDAPSTIQNPPTQDNAAGIVGSYVAYMLRYWIGGGVYMALAFASVAAFILIFGGRIPGFPWRVIGVALLTTATSAAIFLLCPDSQDGIPVGPGGVLGHGVGDFLRSRFAVAGAWLIVVITLCIGLLLAAENLVLQIPTLGRKVWQGRDKLPSVAKAICSLVPVRGEEGAAKPRPADRWPRAKEAPWPGRPNQEGRGGDAVPSQAAGKTAPPTKTVEAKPPPTKAPPRIALSQVPKPPPQKAAPPVAEAKPALSPGGKGYSLPSTELLAEPSSGYLQSQEAQAVIKRQILQQTLVDFNVAAEVIGHMTGPVVTMFELSLAPGVKVSQIGNLANDIARVLAVPGVRVVSPLAGKDTVGIEVPNLQKEIVRIKELMGMAPEAEKRMHLPLYLGKDTGGESIVADLASMPHLLIAGTTGSGKSVCINSVILAILMTRTPEQVRLILIDPKMVEMAAFENIPHLLCPIINDMRRAEDILEWAATKMDERYELCKEAGVKNIDGFNRLGKEELYRRLGIENEEERKHVPVRLPYYIIIVDELADLIMTSSKEVETHIIRIAQKARAVGIHLILATQRPSVNVVTGLIKTNMPCRISFRVASRQDSRIVLDQNGADVLLGQGDMLFLQPGTSNLTRAQGTYVDEAEIRTIVGALRKSSGDPRFDQEVMRLGSSSSADGGGEKDEMFEQAVEIVLGSQRGSVSLLQRRLQIGYSRASRIIDQMADAGLLGDYKGSQARECLLTVEEWQSMKASIAADRSGESSANGEPTSL